MSNDLKSRSRRYQTIKKRLNDIHGSIKQYESGNRLDLSEREPCESKVLEDSFPEAMNESEADTLI